MRRKSILGAAALSSAVLVTLQSNAAFGQLRSFGEAEGFGGNATGGRAATSVYHVTNLNNSGTGSFRDAVSASNRIIVFDVGGIINLTTAVSCQSNLTIAGQTAPGGGISLNGGEVSFSSKSNIICRYLRFRPGDNTASSTDDALGMYDTQNAIVDHCSMEFAPYDTVDAVTDNGNDPNLTIQNSIIADPIGQQFGAHLEAVNGHMTLTGNLWANSHNRNPLAKADDQFVNNIDYNNEASYTTHTSTAFKHDLVNNAFIFGPATGGNTFYQVDGGKDTFYAAGNIQDSNKNGVLDGSSVAPPTSTTTTVTSPNFATTATLPTLTVAGAYQFVTTHAGASQVRDDLDSLVVSQVKTLGLGTTGKGVGTAGPSGGEYGSASSDGLANGGLGNTAAGTRAAGYDTDGDGVPDAYELTHNMNPNSAADGMALNPLGYKMVEQYINEVGATNDAVTSAGVSGSFAATTTWTGGVVPAAMDYAYVTGNGAAAANVSLSSGTANVMTLHIGGSSAGSADTMTVNGGTLVVYDTTTVGENNNATLNVSSGTLSSYNIILGNTVTGGATLNYTGTLNLSGGTLSVAQIALGGGGPGAWTTGGQVNFTGGTLKAQAILNVNAPIAVSGSGGTVDTNSFAGNISGTISGSGGITKIGAGTLTLGGTNTNTGVTKISAGTLAISALTNGGVAGNLGAATNAAANLVIDGGILQYVGTTTTATDRSFTMTAKGATLDAGTTGQVQYIGTSDVAQSGTGNRTLLLTGNTASSNFNLGLGDPTSGKTSLTVTGSGSTSARWLIGASASPRTYSGDTTLTSGTLLTNANNVLPFGAGKGNLVITAGTVELNGNNLAINALTGAGTVNQRGSTNRTLTLGNGDATGSYGGALASTPLSTQGVLNITKVGAGTQTFTGTATYAGNTTVQAGTLAATSTVYSSLLTNAGGLDVQGGTFSFNYTGTSPLAQVRGLLATSYANGFATGQIRDTVAASNIGLAYADSGSAVTLTPALLGDANGDGQVNFSDFLLLQANFGSNGATAAGDFNYDGVVNFSDFLILQSDFGQGLTGSAATVTLQQVAAMTAFAQNVPEPALGLAAVALLPAFLRRRRRTAA